MAYNFLGLVNDVLHQVNEVPLTSSNFTSATDGVYASAKEGVNSAIRQINQQDFVWPFNFNTQEDTLVAGDNRYDYPSDAKWVDFNTFRVKRDNTLGNKTQYLIEGDYEEYLYNHIDDEYNTTDTGIREIPTRIYRGPGKEYILHPVPDKAYTLVYEYYSLQTDLSAYDDVPVVPEEFRHIIVDGAMITAYKFRSDTENMQQSSADFRQGIVNMRKIYVNRYEFMRDGRVHRNPYTYQRTLRTT